MIIKSFIAEKNISVLNDYFAVMFYGENIGLKDDLIAQKNNNDIKIFLFAENFDKKSVLIAFFEKEGNLAIIPCYQDNEKSLSVYTRNHFSNYRGLTQELINKLIKNSGVDRKVLSQEILLPMCLQNFRDRYISLTFWKIYLILPCS